MAMYNKIYYSGEEVKQFVQDALAASQREREQGQSKIAELQARLIERQDMHKAMTLESVALYAQIGLLQARVEAAQKLIAICAKREEGSEDFFDAELNAFLASAAAPNSAPVTSGDLPKAAGLSEVMQPNEYPLYLQNVDEKP